MHLIPLWRNLNDSSEFPGAIRLGMRRALEPMCCQRSKIYVGLLTKKLKKILPDLVISNQKYFFAFLKNHFPDVAPPMSSKYRRASSESNFNFFRRRDASSPITHHLLHSIALKSFVFSAFTLRLMLRDNGEHKCVKLIALRSSLNNN